MPPLFDAYLMVDWSAAGQPVIGASSIWIAAGACAGDGPPSVRLDNPATRTEAIDQLVADLRARVAVGQRVLVGFDFAFGYPAGAARYFDPSCPDWRGVWRRIAGALSDDASNVNDRFALAARLNQAFTGGPAPFWGCPRREARATLTATRPRDGGGFAPFRLTDRAALGSQSVWKLAYPGSVGGQTLTGIARLHHLRSHPDWRDIARVWPFETGLRPLARDEEWQVLFAEIYPSMLPDAPLAEAIAHEGEGHARDARQVHRLVSHFLRLDAQGDLAALFAGPAALTPDERRLVETEEGWILGIDRAPPPEPRPSNDPYVYERDPRAIYARSFALIREEADLASLPPDLAEVAIRLVHACGEPAITHDLAWRGEVVGDAGAALRRGAPILCDSQMVAHGVIRTCLPNANATRCFLEDVPRPPPGDTRSAAAVELWRDELEGAVVAIGNAPTALFRLLELIDAGGPRPAAILAFPVGFVGAAESKEALIAHAAGIPFLTLRGRRGGSALAAAAVNAIAGLASGKP